MSAAITAKAVLVDSAAARVMGHVLAISLLGMAGAALFCGDAIIRRHSVSLPSSLKLVAAFESFILPLSQ